ncbi:hypothetical protein VTI74DRAFT_1790 [Chaetomium olivicolor]
MRALIRHDQIGQHPDPVDVPNLPSRSVLGHLGVSILPVPRLLPRVHAEHYHRVTGCRACGDPRSAASNQIWAGIGAVGERSGGRRGWLNLDPDAALRNSRSLMDDFGADKRHSPPGKQPRPDQMAGTAKNARHSNEHSRIKTGQRSSTLSFGCQSSRKTPTKIIIVRQQNRQRPTAPCLLLSHSAETRQSRPVTAATGRQISLRYPLPNRSCGPPASAWHSI